jgi:hypothetical protein
VHTLHENYELLAAARALALSEESAKES